MARATDPAVRVHALAVFALAGLCFAIYAQTYAFEFVDFDDNIYLTTNERVQAGLTPANAAWAFTTGHHANWHPLTWITWLTEISLFGLDPGVMHVTNTLLHLANALLLYFVLIRYTKAPIPSAFVALLFAVHPLHVESVAWISERKDLLCAFFWLLTLLAYQRYAESPSAIRYALVVVSFSLSLMSKSMSVTLPFVLLLLDYWPLHRQQRWSRLVIEKFPLGALAAVAGVITLLVQRGADSVQSMDTISLPERLANAVTACGMYLYKTIWPVNLAVFYPHPRGDTSALVVVVCAALILVLSAAAIRWRNRAPYLFTGWFWFLITLLPVIGLVQVGGQAYADRYMYLPQIGLSVGIVWWTRSVLSAAPERAAIAVAIFIGVSIGLSAQAVKQVSHWLNTETLFTHAIAVTQRNILAHQVLGRHYLAHGSFNAAEAELTIVASTNPENASVWRDLGHSLSQQGKEEEARAAFESAVDADPNSAELHYLLGLTLGKLEQHNDALIHMRFASELAPNDARILTAYGNSLARALPEGTKHEDWMREVIDVYDRAIASNSSYALSYFNKASFLIFIVGDTNAAAACLQVGLGVPEMKNEDRNSLRGAMSLTTITDIAPPENTSLPIPR